MHPACQCGACEPCRQRECDRRCRAKLRGRPCRHCGGVTSTRPRGLCNWCYADPAVRDLYPPTPTGHNRGGPPAVRVCVGCGCTMVGDRTRANASGLCPTCLLPEPLRSVVAGRIELYGWLADQGIPLDVLRTPA